MIELTDGIKKFEARGTSISKAESTKNTVPKTTLRREVGQPRIVTSSKYIDDQRQTDLKMPTRLITFDNMYQDDAVYNSVDVTNLLVTTALYGGKFQPGPSKSNKSKIAADFLNYCIRNMSYGTYLGFLQNAVTDLKYGFSFQNIVIEKRNYGPYKGSWCLRKLAPRDQKSIYGFVFNKDQTEFVGIVQKPRITQTRQFKNVGWKDGLHLLSTGKVYECDYPFIRKEQLLHFTYNSTNNNPQGDSPLAHCYTAWIEKKTIETLELNGATKDLAGLVVLRAPSDFLQKANDQDNYPDAYAENIALQQNAADLHNGKESFIYLLSDTDDKGKYLYDVNLLGLSGGGKQYLTSEIIKQKKTSIYNCFGTSFLILGDDGVGSYALSGDKATTFSYYVERNILQKSDVLNSQLAPRLLAVNDIYLNWDDMPIYKSKDPTELSLDDIGKLTQRMASVNKLTQPALEDIYEQMGWSSEGLDKLDYTDKGQSRAGDGMSTAGEGTSNSYGGKDGVDQSVANNENTMSKSLVFESETEDQITLIDAKTGNPVFIDK